MTLRGTGDPLVPPGGTGQAQAPLQPVRTDPAPTTATEASTLQKLKDGLTDAITSTQQAVAGTASAAYSKLDEAGVPHKVSEHLAYAQGLAGQQAAAVQDQARQGLAAGTDYIYSTADRVRNASPEEVNQSSLAKVAAGVLMLALSCALIGMSLKLALGLVVLLGLAAYLYQYKASSAAAGGVHTTAGAPKFTAERAHDSGKQDLHGSGGYDAPPVPQPAAKPPPGLSGNTYGSDMGVPQPAVKTAPGLTANSLASGMGMPQPAVETAPGLTGDSLGSGMGLPYPGLKTPPGLGGTDYGSDMGMPQPASKTVPGLMDGSYDSTVGAQAPDQSGTMMGGGLGQPGHQDKAHQLHDQVAHEAAQVATHRDAPPPLHPEGVPPALDEAHHKAAVEAAVVAQQYLPKPQVFS